MIYKVDGGSDDDGDGGERGEEAHTTILCALFIPLIRFICVCQHHFYCI
jgi:hypothetical protein